MKPSQQPGSSQVDTEYLAALVQAVPLNGQSWTYTHFGVQDIPKTVSGQTCINISTEAIEGPGGALEAFSAGYPTVVVRPSSEGSKVDLRGGVRLVRCPAEYLSVTCQTCGGGKPLCARHERNYVIKFTAHGASAKRIDIRAIGGGEAGGCYGNGGPVRLQWERTRDLVETRGDGEVLMGFVAGLKEGSLVRHHVVGDVG